MSRFLTLSYYISPRPDPDFQFTKLTLALIVCFFVLSIIIKIYRKKYAKDAIVKKMIKRYPGKLLLFATILIVLLLTREAGVPFLSMRLWWFLFLIVLIWWVLKIALNFKKEYKRRLKQVNKHAVKAKYLPKKKK